MSAWHKEGPQYPNLSATVSKFRARARVQRLEANERRAYGSAVLDAFRADQRSALRREAAPVSNACYASGTGYTHGRDILAAVQRQHAAALHAKGPAPDPVKVAEKYAEAMAAKRAAQAGGSS